MKCFRAYLPKLTVLETLIANNFLTKDVGEGGLARTDFSFEQIRLK